MDEKYLELIDRYLRKEMSPQESLKFEQEALNNPKLLKEIELTYKIKRRLADRQRKLHQTSEWEKKKQFRSIGLASCISIAAMLIVGILFWKPTDFVADQNNTIAKVENTISRQELDKAIVKNEQTMRKVRESIKNGKDEEALNDIALLEESNVLPPLNSMANNKTYMSNNLYTQERDSLIKDAYELHWLKICALLKIGRKEEAIELLKIFSNIQGEYKIQADSLLKDLERK
ncbi:MAG: hypothetical protein Q4P84_04295 [Elusimicrobiales bacterium]|nr:hypothetical protein [Prevotellaceae bacterium]MDO5764910.1 hypothetical protein [Elusimicrobiales bacterium]